MKKILAVLLTVCMVVCMIPGAAFADTPEGGTSQNTIDWNNAKVTISKQDAPTGNRDYYRLTDLEDGNFYTTYTEVKLNNDSVCDNSGNVKADYTVNKVRNDDCIRITVYNKNNSEQFAFADIDIVTDDLNDGNYFISSDSNASTATALVKDATFTGVDIKPNIYLYKKETSGNTTVNKLVDKKLYEVDYGQDIKNAGNKTIKVKGVGTARGELASPFVIKPADFSKLVITAPNASAGSAPASYDVNVTLNGNTLKKGTDYEVALKDGDSNVNGNFVAGKTYKAIITPKTDANFEGTDNSKTIEFRANNKLTTGTVEVVGTTELVYNGAAQKPTIKVKDESKNELTTYEYKIEYLNSQKKKVAAAIDAGKYTAVITPNSNKIAGTEEIEFSIKPVTVQKINSYSNSYVSMDKVADQKYTGKALTPTVNVYYQDKPSTTKKALVKNKDYTVTYNNNVSVGLGTVTVTFIGNYEGPTLTDTFTITKGTLLTAANTTISGVNDTYDYTGYAIKPTVYVTYRSGYTTKVLTQSTTTRTYDYKVDYSSNIAAGTATITVTGQGEYAGTVTKTFAIKYNLSNATVTATPSTYLYDGKEKKPLVSVKVGYMVVPASNYNVVYSNNTNTGTAAVTVTANKYGNAIGSNSAYFTIKGKDGVITPEYAEYSKKTTKSSPFAIKIVSNTTDGTGYSYTSSDTSVATVSANGTVTPVGCGRTVITITTTGNKAYNPATATVTVTVKPAKGVISGVTSSSKGKLIVKYKRESANATAYQIRYGRAGDYTIKTVKALPSKSGKSTIKGLQSGKKYFVKVRGVKELADGTKIYGNWSKTASAVVK